MATCGICCEAFNKSSRGSICCVSCDAETCKACVVRFLLDTTKDPHCMNCNVAWNAEFLDDHLPSTFINGKYREHRRDILHEREIAMMPETVPFAELHKKQTALDTEIKAIRGKLKWCKSQLHLYDYNDIDVNRGWENIIADSNDVLQFKNNGSNLENQLSRCMFISSVLKRKVTELATGATPASTTKDSSKQKEKYIRPCTTDSCKGFITQGMECKLCDTQFCKECHEPVREGVVHACNDDDVKSAHAIMKEAKPCPRCHTLTFKISGCSQMWCTQCHTPWCWNLGTVETGPIHNPMYFEFMRTQNNVGPDVTYAPRCNVIPDEFQVDTKVRQLALSRDEVPWLYEIIRIYRHTQIIEINMCAVAPRVDNRDLRVKFMVGEINETEFKRRLQLRERSNQKKRDLTQVWTMLLAVLGDLMQKFMQIKKCFNVAERVAIQREFDEVCDFTNAAFKRIVTRYKCAPISVGL